MANQVFICYSSHDKTVANSVCATLESKNIQCWIAPRDVLPGSLWGESVADAIDKSRIVVLVLSRNSGSSSQVIREVERAASNNTPIIPLRIDDMSVSRALGFFVSSRHWLDAQTPPLETHLQRLADTIQRLLSKEYLTQNNIELPEMDEKPAISGGMTIEVAEAAQQVSHCPKCGIKLRPNAIFCHKCGCHINESVNNREAEERARREAEEKARKEAEEKARKEAEEKARKEAEEKARKEAEERARKEAEEKARKEAEEKARKEAEEKARKEAEEKARKEAEERARKEAEEKARKEAEEKARKEAEEKARKEAGTVQQVICCPECGIELRPGASFCNMCGTRVTKIEKEEQPTISVGATVEPAGIVQQVICCPECGIELRPGASFCNKCGTRVSNSEKSR